MGLMQAHMLFLWLEGCGKSNEMQYDHFAVCCAAYLLCMIDTLQAF